MHKFFFNSDCLPACNNQYDLIRLFGNTLTEYKSLADNHEFGIEKGLITDKMPSEIFLGDTISLKAVIDGLQNRELKRIAYSYFIKYPIEDYVSLIDVEAVLQKNCYIKIGCKDYDALNLTFISLNHGFLFTVALHDDLMRNELLLIPRDDSEKLFIQNLYGEKTNTDYIKQALDKLNHQELSLFKKLKSILGISLFSHSFETAFFKLTIDEQSSILKGFEKAKNRNLISPFYPDTNIIKDVTPAQPKCKVYELRVYSPTALRVYFCEYAEKVIVASIEKKSNPDQHRDIRNAHNLLNKLILAGN